MTTLNFNLTVEGIEDEVFIVREYNGTESLSHATANTNAPCNGFRYHIALASRRHNINADDIVDKPVQLEVVRNNLVVQRIHGIVREFGKGDTGHHHTFYHLTLVPALERLALRQNSRIFQLKNAVEIISILLEEMGVNDYAFSLKRECEQREYCVQYRESDLDFLHRLAAEEGVVYSFIHEKGKHTLLFTDSSESLPALSEPVPYNTLGGGISEQPYISGFTSNTKSEVSHTALQDYSFKKPQYNFLQTALGNQMEYQRTDVYEYFDAPGRFKDDVNGKAFNQVRLEYLRREAHTAKGESDQALLQAGYRFDLQDHMDDSNNREWVVVCIEHKGSQPQALEEEGGQGTTSYSNTFTVVPSSVTWRAKPEVKPQVDGPSIAMVVGPENEEIFCDEHGRVKVHFPWDRYSSGDENSSCWVRVSQEWAGSQYGMMTIPRIGHEVIISFLNGDPDQPIITGRTYHATNTPPYSLPEHKTKTVLRSETHQGSGFNEISFEDQVDKEQIYMHGQKNFDVDVQNDMTTQVKNDQHLTVDSDQFTLVNNNQHLTVQGEKRTKVTGDFASEVKGSLHQKVGAITVLDAGEEVHLKAGNKVVVEAGSSISVKAGGSFVKIDASGVSLVGPGINLNSGGSAGSGSGYAGLEAMLPMGLEALDAPEELLFVQPSATLIQQVIADIKTEMPITQVCQKKADGSCPLSDCPCGNNQ